MQKVKVEIELILEDESPVDWIYKAIEEQLEEEEKITKARHKIIKDEAQLCG